ncbi:primosomal protein N' [Candidatus Dependentiae bacterium]|nr:primosomal protein N' [Candidatus Dependentiae bacterium]
MYILVKLLKGFPKPLFYQIPEKFFDLNLNGKIVNVPIKNNSTPALVLKTYKKLPKNINFKIKKINELHRFPEDNLFKPFIEKISDFYFLKPIYFYQRIRNFLLKDEKIKNKISSITNTKNINVKLTKEQNNVFDFLKKFIDKNEYKPTLLHGVTGSGKTEIYKKLITETINKNKSIVLLLPEVSLAMIFENLLKKQLPEHIKIIGFHSASKNSTKKELWQNLLDKKPMLIIGVHLPILLPIPNLGLIIVDEEHEIGFQEKKHPKINSKELAIWRAQFYKIPILLGSATPSINSLYNVKNKNWNFLQLIRRFSGNFPKVELVKLKKAYKRPFWISKELEKEIKKRLEKKEQTIIYINRRGFSFFMQCKNCGFIFECPNCSVSLTLHQNSTDQSEILRCHYCDYTKAVTKNCPQCKNTKKDFLKKGIGTQQTVKILQHMFPFARIERADLDTTTKKRSWNKTVESFERGDIDILVGTQVITKGYHFPKVTLVGILWADLNLHFPIFNASETCLQKIIQVAGRAGRQSKESKVIIQTINDHEIFNHINEKDYLEFCKKEFDIRELTGYPPFKRLIQIELKNTIVEQLEKDSIKLYQEIENQKLKNKINIKILGPAKPIIYKIQKTETRHIFIKTSNFKNFYEIIKKININKFESKIFIVPT